MIKKCISTGFIEVDHTADWAIKVWAEDLSCLFEQAARGMYSLMEIQLDRVQRETDSLELESQDDESLLVLFLSELLYKIESKGLAYDKITAQVDGTHLKANLEGSTITYQKKEIKAVTFHNLEIIQTDGRFEVTIVFDV